MNSPDVIYKWLDQSDLDLIVEIDRSEHITKTFLQKGPDLTIQDVDWQVPGWVTEGEGDHSINHIKSFCSDHLGRGAVMLGAFTNGRLVGVGILQPNLRPSTAQIAFLHVSLLYRRIGIASRILKDLIKSADEQGAKRIYISATPSGSAVGFYLHHGFRPTGKPLPELLSLEPDDIHMVKRL
ncbi:MAG: N-acetyltransferase [Anaerolineae bacterium]|nr:MAG: N-acetyltransferase [Anaerolineae bacterium]